MLKDIIMVAAGGAAGSVARYLTARAVQGTAMAAFPAGTMTVNILGCLAIGIVYGLCDNKALPGADMRLLLATGFCGGFTTFSTFANESLELFRSGSILTGSIYTAGSVALGMAAVATGMQITKII